MWTLKVNNIYDYILFLVKLLFYVIVLIFNVPKINVLKYYNVFCYKLVTKGTLPISLNYTLWPISGNLASQVISIKLKYLRLVHRKPPNLCMVAGRKKSTHPLQSLAGTRTILFLFSNKRSLNSHLEVVLWDVSPSSSWTASFPNKVIIPGPRNHSIYWLVMQWGV